jgi:hypothetical protein
MTFLLPLLGIGKTVLQWLARLPWWAFVIVAVLSWGVIERVRGDHARGGWKAERVAHGVTRDSVRILAERIAVQNAAVTAMAKDSKDRIQAGKVAITARSKARVAVDSRIAALSIPVAFKDGCATPDDVAGSGL